MTEKLPIYRKGKDGSRIRVPGDERDPKRRYSRISTPSESYDLEFTDDEEKQRDDEEARWKEERPQRESEAKNLRIKNQRFIDSLRYQKRIVAFLDILGWRSKIEQSKGDPNLTKELGITLNSLSQLTEISRWLDAQTDGTNYPGDLQISQFSDTIVLSVSYDEIGINLLFTYLQTITRLLTQLGMLARGGTSASQLIHKPSFVYGPALIRAYELESTKTIIPRIILDPDFVSDLGQNIPVTNTDGNLIGHQKTWKQDSDSYYFYDFLQPLLGMPGLDTNIQYIDSILSLYRKLICDGLDKFRNNERIFPKYEWGANYFNTVLSEHPQSSLNHIILTN